MTKAVNFQAGHLDVFEVMFTDDMTPAIWDAFKSDLDYMAVSGDMEVASIICDNEITAIVGGKTISQGVVQVWMIPGKSFKEHTIATHKKILELLESVEKENHRTQMTVRESFKRAQDWAESLGFKKEATLVEYDADGTNHDLYVRF